MGEDMLKNNNNNNNSNNNIEQIATNYSKVLIIHTYTNTQHIYRSTILFWCRRVFLFPFLTS